MDSSTFFHLCYQYGLWISVPLMGVGLYLLIHAIMRVIRVIKEAHVATFPLVEEQEVTLPEAGRLVLSGEGPLITFRFAGLKYHLTAPDGTKVPGRPAYFRAKTSGLTSSRMEFRVYTLPEPGTYLLRVEGLGEPKATDEQHHLVFMRPHLANTIACILGILLGSALLIGNLVFFLLHLLADS